MITGTVKFFNADKGYGFIQPDDNSGDAFVHITAVEAAGMRCVVITTTLARDAFAEFDNVIAIVDDFSSLSLDELFA